MPQYKKKKHSRILSSPGKPKKNRRVADNFSENIEMSSKKVKKNTPSQSGMKIIKGRKLEQKRRTKVFLGFVSVVLIFLFVFRLFFPAGLVTTISNMASLLGSGSYPIALSGNETINAISYGNYFYVLTGSSVEAYNSTGKQLFTYEHGFEKPIIKTSAYGAIVFNQGGNYAAIFNLKGFKETITTEKEIITGAISDSGVYALATHSDEYASDVMVYSKKNKLLFEWFSAENTVNNIAISPNGRKIAVSGFNSGVGKYKTVLNVLNFKSANPEFTENYDGTLVYNLDTSSKSGFMVVTQNKIKFIKWSNQKSESHENDYNIAYFKSGKIGSVAVFNRESDKTDNRIEVYNKSGKIKTKFEFKGIVSDIGVFGNHIYCMSDTDIYLLGDDGKVLRKASCGFGSVKLAVTGTNNVAVITDNEIEKVKLVQTQENE